MPLPKLFGDVTCPLKAELRSKGIKHVGCRLVTIVGPLSRELARRAEPPVQNRWRTTAIPGNVKGVDSVNVSTDSVTSVNLLGRLQQAPADDGAWAEFVARYGLRINGWCRDWGLQEADVQDVTQTVLMKLVKAMQTFRYDPSQRFRAWLKTITHHAWQDLMRNRRETAEAGYAAGGDDPLQAVAARDRLWEQMEAAYEQELMECALARVRPRVQPLTWEAFRLTALEGVAGATASDQLGMAVSSVYKAKSNVLKLLGAEVQYLESGVT